MSATEIISLIAMLLVSGGVASYVVQWIKRADWGSRPKYLTSLAVSIAFGLATAIGDALQHRLQPTAYKIFCSVSGVLLLSADLNEVMSLSEGRVWRSHIILPLAVALIGSVGYHAISAAVLFLTGTEVDWVSFARQILLPSALLNAALILPIYAFVRWLHSLVYPEAVV